MKSLFNRRLEYKPFWYPWAYEAFVASEQMHWLSREVPLTDDVKDWRTKLSQTQRDFLTHIFRYFTQGDVDIAVGYIDRYLPTFKPIEIRMALASIAAREGVHVQAYSTLIDEVGIPEVEYSAFTEYQEMMDKHDFLEQRQEGLLGLALDIVKYSAFGEGLQLFASFVMLLNFTRFGLMTGMGQMISWSIRDETHHVDTMVQLYHELVSEVPELQCDELGDGIYEIAERMVELEDRFIELAFRHGGIEGLEMGDVKQYIRYIADVRLRQLQMTPLYNIEENPLPWVDSIVFGKEHTNFFENRPTDYAKGNVEGDWGDAFDDQ